MKRRWLGIAICAAVLLAAGCSSGTDVSRAADASAVKAAPVEKKKVYVSRTGFESVLDGNQEESEDIWFWNVPGVRSRMRRLIRKATSKAPTT